MTLSKLEKKEVLQNLDIEIGSMFDRLSSNYSGPDQTEKAKFIPELEEYVKECLLDPPDPD